MQAGSARAVALPRVQIERVAGVGGRGECRASTSASDMARFSGHAGALGVPGMGACRTARARPGRRTRVVRCAAPTGDSKGGGWLRPLEGLAQRMGVTIYQAPAPPAVVPGARVDFLESMLQWHLESSTSVDLVMREVQDAIVQEVTSFPVDKVAVGESPSVAMHVPIPLLRANSSGPPMSLNQMGMRSAQALGNKRSDDSSTSQSGSGYASGDGGPLPAFPTWDGWTQPTTALTLRAVLMTAGALSAAAGMRPTGAGEPGADPDADPDAPQILLPLNPEVVDVLEQLDVFRDGDDEGVVGGSDNSGNSSNPKTVKKESTSSGISAERLRVFFNQLWPDSPYTFGTYDRQQINSDISYLSSQSVRQKKNSKRLVVIVNISSPGDENCAESDGEGMVNAAETLLELNVPFVVLTLWMDDSLARSVGSGKPAKTEKEALRVRMEKRTRILLGRSVKRKEARENVRLAFQAAKKAPQGAGYVALEEALAEARAVGADTSTSGVGMKNKASEAEAMLAEIRAEARAAEASALAAALTSNCLQVPVDIAGLEANLRRARGVIDRAERDALAVDALKRVDAEVGPSGIRDPNTARAIREWNESAAGAETLLSSTDEDGEADGDGSGSIDQGLVSSDNNSISREVVMSADVDRFASGANASSVGQTQTTISNISILRDAVNAAEAALEAAELEGDLRIALADETSLEVSAVPKLEALMLRAAKVAERKPPLTQEGAAKLNALTSRCFSRATALQEMEEARAALAKALEPSLRGEDLLLMSSSSSGGTGETSSASTGLDHKTSVPSLERAIARAKAAAWPWQLADAVVDAENVLERWQAIGRVRDALQGRDMKKIKREIQYAKKAHPEVETRGAEKMLAELEAEDALEGGDRRLKAYFAASKMAWASGPPSVESAEMLRTIRDSLAVTDAEHDQVTKAVSAGSRTAAETTHAEMLRGREGSGERATSSSDTSSSRDTPMGDPEPGTPRVSFSASGTGTRGPMFEGSEAIYTDDDSTTRDSEFSNATELYVLNWDDETIELYVGGAGPKLGFLSHNLGDTATDVAVVTGGDEASVAWASAVEDGDSNDTNSGTNQRPSSWRRVGADIIYNEEEIIGVGSSGTYVFRGYVQHTTRARHLVAVKRIQRPPGEEGRELLKLVEREVELLTALNQSPKVPFFHRWAATSSHVFIALELCAESLREHVTRLGDSMPVQRRFDILSDISSGIAWLHDPSKPGGRIAHNDLKPENLLVDSEGLVKIADVGLGVQLSKTGSNKGLAMKDGKVTGSQNSTEYTMSTFRKYGIDIVLAGRAPEMLKHKPLTPAADVWAMGVVFYFVFTGRASPFSETGRDIPTDAAIINGRHHLQNLMTVPGLVTRRALEARHLLASMLAPDPENRPSSSSVQSHPLFWSDDEFLTRVQLLHQRSSSFDKDVGSVLSDVADDALLNGMTSGNSERGALLAAASMDLTDWKRLVDEKLLKRITTAHTSNSRKQSSNSGNNLVDSGRKPYGDSFGDLLRFCRNASEHPPSFEEVEPLLKTLKLASVEVEKETFKKAAAASAKKSRQLERRKIREGGKAGSVENNADQSQDDTSDSVNASVDDSDSLNSSDIATPAYPGTALLPPNVDGETNYKKLTREQRKSILAAYLCFLFPGFPLAVFEVSEQIEATALAQKEARVKRGRVGKKNVSGRVRAATRGR